MENLTPQPADLFSAIRRADAEQVKRLLAAGMSPAQKTAEGLTANKLAELMGNADIIQMLRSAAMVQAQRAQMTFALSANIPANIPANISANISSAVALIPPALATHITGTDVFSGVLSIGPTRSPSSHPPTQPTYRPPRPKPSKPLAAPTPRPTRSADKPSAPAPKAPSTAELKQAVCCNDIKTVEALLKAKVSFKLGTWYDTPLLVLAAERGYSEVVQALLDAGDDPNKGYARLPLHIASEHGHLETVQRLLNSGARVRLEEEGGKTALMRAAASGHLQIVQTLIDKGANVDAICRGETALMIAARSGHRQVYEFLYPYVRTRGMSAQHWGQQQQATFTADASNLESELAALFEGRR